MIVAATCALSTAQVWAQEAAYCAPGQALDWQPVLVPLAVLALAGVAGVLATGTLSAAATYFVGLVCT